MVGYLVLLSMLVLTSAYTEQNGVVALTEDDFALAVKQHEYLFVKFYTPWCGYCKKIAPIFIQLAAELKVKYPSIRLADIDLDQHKSIQSLMKIQSYPTLIFFKNGVPINFGGARTKQFMTQWLGKKTQDPIIAIDQSRVATLQNDGNVNIIFYGDIQSAGGKILLKLAETDDYNMFYQVKSSKGLLEIYRPFGQPIRTTTLDHSIRSWVSLYDRPFVFQYDDRTSSELFTEKRNGVLLFVPTSEESLAIISAFKETAEDFKVKQKKKLIFTQIQANTEAYTGFSNHIKINPALYPIVFIKNAEKLKYVLKANLKDITSAKIIQFLKLIESGKIRKYKLDEQTRPKSEQPTPTAEL